MNEKLITLFAYVELLCTLHATGHSVNREINEALEAIRKEMGL